MSVYIRYFLLGRVRVASVERRGAKGIAFAKMSDRREYKFRCARAMLCRGLTRVSLSSEHSPLGMLERLSSSLRNETDEIASTQASNGLDILTATSATESHID